MMSESELKQKILKLLKEKGEAYTKEIAKAISISTTTASKYLNILEAEGRVEKRIQKPYTYWRIKNNGGNLK